MNEIRFGPIKFAHFIAKAGRSEINVERTLNVAFCIFVRSSNIENDNIGILFKQIGGSGCVVMLDTLCGHGGCRRRGGRLNLGCLWWSDVAFYLLSTIAGAHEHEKQNRKQWKISLD